MLRFTPGPPGSRHNTPSAFGLAGSIRCQPQIGPAQSAGEQPGPWRADIHFSRGPVEPLGQLKQRTSICPGSPASIEQLVITGQTIPGCGLGQSDVDLCVGRCSRRRRSPECVWKTTARPHPPRRRAAPQPAGGRVQPTRGAWCRGQPNDLSPPPGLRRAAAHDGPQSHRPVNPTAATRECHRSPD
jgi:hypothetical protein